MHEALGAVGAELHGHAVRLGRQASLRVAARPAGHDDVELVAGDLELVEFLGVTVQRAHQRDVVDGDGLAPVEQIGQARVLQVYSSLDPAILGEADKVDVRSHGVPCDFLDH